jgi:cysteine synthase A
MVHEIDANGGYLLSRLERVRQLCESTHFVWANQYSNPANPLAHYYHTGPEIYLQMNGNVDAVFIAVSTGGTLAGIGRYLREVSPSTRIVGVDAKGSIVFGGIAGPRKLTGIGSSRKSSFLAPELYDQYILVGDEEAFSFCRALYSHVGIKVGGSSGAVLAACSQYLKSHPEIHRVVCLCPDKGDNYQTSIFNDLWLEKNGLILSENKIWPTTNIVLTNKKLYPVNVSLVKQ